jgi:hypothetical protein
MLLIFNGAPKDPTHPFATAMPSKYGAAMVPATLQPMRTPDSRSATALR